MTIYEGDFIMDYIAKLLKKHHSGSFKKLGNNPVALTKFNYVSEVLPDINNYMVTDKADGERAFLIARNGTYRYVTSRVDVKFTPLMQKGITVDGVFDCELVNRVLYVFDVLEWHGENVSTRGFEERHQYVNAIGQLLNGNTRPDSNPNSIGIKAKLYRKLTLGTYARELLTAFREKRPYKIDGLIFTNCTADYNKTKNFKWKPPEQLTIDFLYIGGLLCVGIDKKSWLQYGFPLPKNYAQLVAPLSYKVVENDIIIKNYFPVPFHCSLGDFSKCPVEGKLENKKIVELSWDKAKSKWIFHRVRDDREGELKSGHYYGNNYKIAEQTLQASLNPLCFGDLIAPYQTLTKGFYFQKQDDSYRAVRKFNNYVKDIVIKRHRSPKIMDMASGKGQDLKKYMTADVNELIMIEIDINAIDEIIDRKYEHLGRAFVASLDAPINITQPKTTGCMLRIFHLDLNKPWKESVAAIGEFKPGSIFCNLAFHYMVADLKHMDNICAFVSHYLEKGGEFVFTALDGATVFNIIKHGEYRVDDKYMLQLVKPKNPTDKFKGFEKINVLLPCSNEPYEEALINLFEVDKVFRKYGIIRVEHQIFNKLLKDFKDYRSNFYSELSEEDIKFTGLYSYTVYKKM